VLLVVKVALNVMALDLRAILEICSVNYQFASAIEQRVLDGILEERQMPIINKHNFIPCHVINTLGKDAWECARMSAILAPRERSTKVRQAIAPTIIHSCCVQHGIFIVLDPIAEHGVIIRGFDSG